MFLNTEPASDTIPRIELDPAELLSDSCIGSEVIRKKPYFYRERRGDVYGRGFEPEEPQEPFRDQKAEIHIGFASYKPQSISANRGGKRFWIDLEKPDPSNKETFFVMDATHSPARRLEDAEIAEFTRIVEQEITDPDILQMFYYALKRFGAKQ